MINLSFIGVVVGWVVGQMENKAVADFRNNDKKGWVDKWHNL